MTLLIAYYGWGQPFSSEVFHEGHLITSEKDSVKGKLKYDLETNNVTIVSNGKTYSFSSQKIFYFEIFDEIFSNYRQFYAIPYEVSFDYKIPVFFELIYEGKVSLLRRERIVSRTVNTTTPNFGGGNVVRFVVEYSYYFLDTEGDIKFFTGKKKDLFLYMADKQVHLKKFIKENKLNVDKAADLIRITAFYNSI